MSVLLLRACWVGLPRVPGVRVKGLLRVKNLPGDYPKPPFGLILDSSDVCSPP